MVTSFGSLAADAASSTAGFFHCHSASPPRAATALPRNTRRRTSVAPSRFGLVRRSRSESNISPPSYRGFCGSSSAILLHSLSAVQVREFLPQVFYLGSIVEQDVRLVGMQRGVVLVIGLRRIKPLERHNLSDDRTRKDF